MCRWLRSNVNALLRRGGGTERFEERNTNMNEQQYSPITDSDAVSENVQDEEQELEQVAESLGYPEAEAKKIAHEYIADEQNS